MDKLIEMIKHHEGVVPHAYKDSRGYLTIGVGRLIDEELGGGLSDDEIDYLVDAMLEVPKNQYGVGPKTVGPKGHALRSLRLYEIAMYGESSDYHQTVSDENAIRDFNIAQQALAHQEEYLQRIGNRQKREPGPVRSRGIFRRR